ncbi:MAG: DUF4431 domain-containing protein [Hyphomicrobiales bacterium]
MRTRFAALLAMLGVLALAPGLPARSQSCMASNAPGQIAEGKLVVKKAHDAAGRPERPYILELPASTCLEGATPDDRVGATRSIHLFSSDGKVHAAIGGLVGRHVRVRGSPFPAHTAHHHAPIVMDVSEIDGI